LTYPDLELTILGKTANSTTIGWADDAGEWSNYTSFDLYRDGSLLWSGSASSYTDTNINDGQVYTYTLTANGDTTPRESTYELWSIGGINHRRIAVSPSMISTRTPMYQGYNATRCFDNAQHPRHTESVCSASLGTVALVP
jgi:hypothetical protein